MIEFYISFLSIYIFKLFLYPYAYIIIVDNKNVSTRFTASEINVFKCSSVKDSRNESTYKYGRYFSPVIYFFVYDRFISRIFTFALPISRGEFPAPQGMRRCIPVDERLRYIVPSRTNPVAKIRAAHSRTRESH